MDEQGLVVVKDSFLSKVVRFLKRFFSKKETYSACLFEKDLDNEIDIEYIKEDKEFVQEEILRARSAFRKYVINNNKNISLDILNYIDEKLTENENKITKIIEINEDDVTFEDIKKLLQDAKEDVNQFKMKDEKTGCYQVPVGVLGVKCSGAKECITNMIKAITTRNSIIVLDENYSRYSTESLILLIVKECLRNFYVDDDIIQMFEKEEIDVSKLDKLICGDNIEMCEKTDDVIYIYQEDECFAEDVRKQVEKLKGMDEYKDFEVKAVSGEFGNMISFFNSSKPFAVCMYTSNSQKAYKFINWVNCGNVFVNTGVVNCREILNNKNEYVNFKYVLHEDVF